MQQLLFPIDLDRSQESPVEPVVDLTSYDQILVAFSGGKDSLALICHLLDLGVPRDKIELHHHDVDGGSELMDWPVTRAYCQAVADALGIKIYFSYRIGGFEAEMLRKDAPTAAVRFETPEGYVIQVGGKSRNFDTRWVFPQVSADLGTRWCSPYLKIMVMDALINNSDRFLNKRTLVLTGERGEESANRAKYEMLEPHRTDNRAGVRRVRHVDHWRPIKNWSEVQVWAIIERYKIRPHPAYELGWSRCSCAGCIFGSAAMWATLKHIAPNFFEKIASYEDIFGKTIKRKESIRSVAARGRPYPAALANPELAAIAFSEDYPFNPVLTNEPWVHPAGAFGENAGPT